MLRTTLSGLLILSMALSLAACSNPHKEAAKASAQVDREKAKIMQDYRKCLKKHPGNEGKCDSYSKAIGKM